MKIDSVDFKTVGVLAKTYYKLGKHYNKINDHEKAKFYFDKALSVISPSFKVIKYKLKSAIEFSKTLFDKGEFKSIQTLLTPLLSDNDHLFRKNPEILNEINQILDNVGSKTKILNGTIVHVNTFHEYILIQPDGDPTFRYIANKTDFTPVLNSINRNLKDRTVKFIPKVYLFKGKEKREAKNIIIIA